MFALLGLFAPGCGPDGDSAAHNALSLTVQGTSEDLYGLEVVVAFEGRDAIERPLGGDGRVLLSGAPVGDARITLRDLRRRFATLDLTVASPGEHEIALVPGTHLRTTIRGADGAALDSADIVVWGGGFAPLSFTPSGPRASFGPLPPGTFKLVVSSPGYQTRVVDLDVKRTRTPGTVRDLPDLRLEKGGATLRGKLALDSQAGRLRAFLRHSGASQEIELRPDGSFELRGLAVARAAIEATLVVRKDGRELVARDLRIAADLDLGRIALR